MATTLTIDQALQHALGLHRKGQRTPAREIYEKILAAVPNHADALHLLGMLLHEENQIDQALALVQQAVAAAPETAVFHGGLGIIFTSANRLDDAVAAYRRSLELSPDSPGVLNNLAAVLDRQNKSADAVELLRGALRLDPAHGDAKANLWMIAKKEARQAIAVRDQQSALDWYFLAVEANPSDAETLHFLGSLLHEKGSSESAVQYLRQSLRLNPRSAETSNNLGNALFKIDRFEESISAYQQALSLRPDFPEALNNLGNVLKLLGRVEEAIAAYSRSISLHAGSPEPFSNLGNLFREAGQRQLALRSYESALQIDPQHAQTHNNLANAYCESGEWNRAIDCYRHALAINPDYADALSNLGTALEELGDRDQAMACYERAMLLDPRSSSAPWNMALLRLLRGDYARGWPGYEFRWHQPKQAKTFRHFSQPLLSLDPAHPGHPRGQRVLLHAEQGFGDTLQFCRYVPMVAAEGATVILEVPAPLLRICSTLPGITEIIAHGAALPSFAVQAPLMSLPMVFKTTLDTIPAKVPYLLPDNRLIPSWQKRLRLIDPNHLKVGLAWAGGQTHQKDRHRSLKLSDFAILAGIPQVTFISLQLGEPGQQAASPPPGMQLIDWTNHLRDFADSAALVSQLDLVIAVDTSVGHLTSAIGVPAWILLAFCPDWRWMLDRSDSPWYPKTRLFRQKTPGQWSDPLQELAGALREKSAEHAARSGHR